MADLAVISSEKHETPATPADLLVRLQALGIAYALHHHPAFFTVAEAEKFEHEISGTHCRNLFIRDKRDRMFLVVAENATKIDLKKLAPLIGADRISFGSSDRLMRHLGVKPGSVCPFAVINDTDHQVKIVLDAAMMGRDRLNYHPLDNTMTVGVDPEGLLRFLASTGHTPHILDMTTCAPEEQD